MDNYKYKDFNEYWRAVVPAMWDVKQWNNETIKAWMEEAFLSSRDKNGIGWKD